VSEVACAYGQCILARSCDRRSVTCDAAAPTCPEGELPSAREGCWGPCIRVADCRDVATCDDCPGAFVCVEMQLFGITRACATAPTGCTKGNYCGCLASCGDYGCTEIDDRVACYCPFC
jgi:hypothetical protein